MQLHMMLDYDGCLPEPNGLVHEDRIVKQIVLPKGSVVVADRGYMDFVLFDLWNKQKLNFVVRCKETVQLDVIAQYELGPEPVMYDEDVVPALKASRNK
jgi:hypothetical protein